MKAILKITEGGSPDPKLNKRLADMIESARSNQVPMETIQKILTAAKVIFHKHVCFNLREGV